MFSIFTRPALCVSFFCLWLACPQFFLRGAETCLLQSRIEDRVNKPETPTKKSSKPAKRVVWNLDGGVFFATDGHLQNGSCFRMSGQVTAPDFFNGLRRIDDGDGASFLLHDKSVTEFPEELFVSLRLRDAPCTHDLRDTTVRPPLTPGIMSTLRLHFYWKDGVALRPVEGSKRTSVNVAPLAPFSKEASDELTPRYEWNYTFTIPSEGVPLTHDLVFIIESEDHKIAARTAARL